MKRTLAFFAVFSFVVLYSVAASAQSLIGSEYSGWAVYEIDAVTGDFVTLGDSGANRLPGLAYNPTTDTLYGTDEENLFTVNKFTGVATLVGAHGIASDITGLTFNAGHTLLYSLGYDDNLYSVNPVTGAASLIGSMGLDAGYDVVDLATDSGGTVYAAGLDEFLYTVNTTTGAATSLGQITGFEDRVTAIAFSDVDVLFAIAINSDRLMEINTSTRVATAVGTASIGSDVRGMAFVGEVTDVRSTEPVPALNYLALLAMSLILTITGWVAIKS